MAELRGQFARAVESSEKRVVRFDTQATATPAPRSDGTGCLERVGSTTNLVQYNTQRRWEVLAMSPRRMLVGVFNNADATLINFFWLQVNPDTPADPFTVLDTLTVDTDDQPHSSPAIGTAHWGVRLTDGKALWVFNRVFEYAFWAFTIEITNDLLATTGMTLFESVTPPGAVEATEAALVRLNDNAAVFVPPLIDANNAFHLSVPDGAPIGTGSSILPWNRQFRSTSGATTVDGRALCAGVSTLVDETQHVTLWLASAANPPGFAAQPTIISSHPALTFVTAGVLPVIRRVDDTAQYLVAVPREPSSGLATNVYPVNLPAGGTQADVTVGAPLALGTPPTGRLGAFWTWGADRAAVSETDSFTVDTYRSLTAGTPPVLDECPPVTVTDLNQQGTTAGDHLDDLYSFAAVRRTLGAFDQRLSFLLFRHTGGAPRGVASQRGQDVRIARRTGR